MYLPNRLFLIAGTWNSGSKSANCVTSHKMTLSVRSEKVKKTSNEMTNYEKNLFFCIKSHKNCWMKFFFSMISCFVALIEFNGGNQTAACVVFLRLNTPWMIQFGWKFEKSLRKLFNFFFAWNSWGVSKWMVKRWRLLFHYTFK